MADFNPPLTVRNCGNPEHGPKWACHRVTDATGRILLLSVDRETAETFASVASLRARVAELEKERDAAQQRAKALRAILVKVVGETPDAWSEWETGEGEPLGPELMAVLRTKEAP